MVKVGCWIKNSFNINKGIIHHGKVVTIFIMLGDDTGNEFRHGFVCVFLENKNCERVVRKK